MKNKVLIPLFLLAASLLIFSGCEEEEKNQKPTCTITNPSSGAKIPKDTTITISVEAEDKDGKIREGRLFVDNSEIKSVSSFPFDYEWNTNDISTGSHVLKAIAIDDKGASGEDTIQISIGNVPEANFITESTKVNKDSSVNFSDESSNNPNSWQWDFGDGSKSTKQNPSHSYSSTGSYTVKLTVSNDYGSDTEVKNDYITVGIPPMAAFRAEKTEVKVRNPLNFIDESTNKPKSWEWKFGDGNISNNPSPTHTYSSEGTYTVELTVTNDYGSDTETKTDYIRVAPLKKWEFKTDGWVYSPAIGSDGTIYVGTKSNYFYSVNPNGTEKWRFEGGDAMGSSPVIGPDGTIYMGSWDNYLYALNPDGSLKWKFETGDGIESTISIASDGTIYVGSTDNYLYAINPDGTKKWQFKTGGRIHISTAIGKDGTIYVGSGDNYLYAVNPDGTEKWKLKYTDGYNDSSPAIGSDGTIYIGSRAYPVGYLYAINPDGTEKWKFRTQGTEHSSPSIGPDGTIYIGSKDNYLYAINPDGTEKWKFETGDYVYSSPAIGSDGTVYVGSSDNYFYAINPDGTEKWKYKTGESILLSPVIGSDGTVYVGSADNYLYAIKGETTLADSPWPMFQHDPKHTGRKD